MELTNLYNYKVIKLYLPGGERTKELELNEQSAGLKEQMQKERDAANKYQQELQQRAEQVYL